MWELPTASLQRGIRKPSVKAHLKNSLDVKQTVKRKGAQAFWTPMWSLQVQLAGIREQEESFHPYLQLFKGRVLVFISPTNTHHQYLQLIAPGMQKAGKHIKESSVDFLKSQLTFYKIQRSKRESQLA